MDRAQVVQDGDRLIVILPDMYRLPVGEVAVALSGRSLLLTPIEEQPLVLPAVDDPRSGGRSRASRFPGPLQNER